MIVKSNGYDSWNILSGEKVVGKIEKGIRYGGGSPKYLLVGEKSICQVKNQREAVEKLEEFFMKNKLEIKEVENLINELVIGMTQVSHKICIDALEKEKSKLEERLKYLKSLDLID